MFFRWMFNIGNRGLEKSSAIMICVSQMVPSLKTAFHPRLAILRLVKDDL